MLKKFSLVALLTVSVVVFIAQKPPQKVVSVRDQVNRALGGKVIRIDTSQQSYPEESPLQRITLIYVKDGVQSRAFMEYRMDANYNILQRRLIGPNNSVLWSASAPALTDEERLDGYANCLEECKKLARQTPARRRYWTYVLCSGICDCIWDPFVDGPVR